MKVYSLTAIPIAFVAGLVSIVLLQKADIVHIGNQPDKASNPVSGAESVAGPTVRQAQDSSAGINATNTANLNVRINNLQQQLRDSTLSADNMQVRVNELEEKLENALQQSAFLPTGEVFEGLSESSSTQSAENARNSDGKGGRNNGGFGGFGNDASIDNLLAAGVDPAVAEELKRQTDQWALQRLELIDQASREGWRRSDEFGERMEELRELQPDIRDELGEATYDRYLYESGDSNRVEVSDVIDGSAAQLAGIQYGDVVLSYADSRVFTSRELQRSTRDGSRGESVQVQVLRDGQLISVDLPRGPLGVTLSGARLEPDAN